MKEKDFIFWLKGFVSACNSHMPTPAQWDILVDTLKQIEDSRENVVKHSALTGTSGNINVGPSSITKAPIRFFTTTTNTPIDSNEEVKVF